ncbi:tetratricopeptide repeat protein [Flagellimonas onchidii]|uniref:tetratricopeptide repeat protein n=1 Tax=Flagellimonas onchidii TaxID=2562684 RepID=UPI0010A5A6FF|nr:tetratricopeptide repeat protein [Allomuricauda onchidii]
MKVKIVFCFLLTFTMDIYSQNTLTIKMDEYNREDIVYDLDDFKAMFPEVHLHEWLASNQTAMTAPDAFSMFADKGDYMYDNYYPEKAIRYYKEALRIRCNESDGYIWNRVGNSYSDIEMYEEAITSYQNFLEISCCIDELVALTNIGRTYIDLGDYDAAIEYYLMAYELDDTYQRTLSGLGNAFTHKNTQESFDKAIFWYKKALEIEEEDLHVVWHNLGTIHSRRKIPDYKKAMECWNKALEIEPFFAETLLNKADYYFYQENQHQKALEYVNKSASLKPRLVNVWELKARIHSSLKEYENAISAYRKYIDLNPNNVIIQMELVELLLITNQFKEASFELGQTKEIISLNRDKILGLFHEFILLLIKDEDVSKIQKELTELQNKGEVELNWSFELIEEWLEKSKTINNTKKEKIHRLVNQLD